MTISDRELQEIRAEQEKYLPGRATIRGSEFIAEGRIADGTIASNVPYRSVPGFGFFREVADRMAGVTAYTLTFPVGTPIVVGNKVIDETSGETFEVRDVRDHKSYQTVVQVLGDRIS